MVYNKKRDYNMRAATGEGCEKKHSCSTTTTALLELIIFKFQLSHMQWKCHLMFHQPLNAV